ncbi:MAG: M20/M25/M40 family metallo-hydrolase [Ignavibacteria bacterium]
MKKAASIVFLFIALVNVTFAQTDKNYSITPQNIYEHVKYLASDKLEGRFPGSEGIQLAKDYISNEFEKYGLTPYGEQGFFQEFEMVTGVSLGTDNFLKLTTKKKEFNLKINKDFTPLSYSVSGEVTGEVVFIGYGISAPELNYDDYIDANNNPIDVEGKIVLLMRYSPEYGLPVDRFSKFEDTRFKTIIAREKKAKAVIVFNGEISDEEDYLHKFGYEMFPNTSGIPIVQIKREVLKNILLSNGITIDKIEADYRNNKGTVNIHNFSSHLKVDIKVENVKTANVIGFIQGNDENLKDEVIVIGAHYDHLGYGTSNSLYTGKEKLIHYGADDNASGTAGVLELAHYFSLNREQLKRSVLFICFSGEEEGLLGSNYFVNSSIFKKLNIVAMINMDMIGRLRDNKLIINGVGTSSVWDSLIKITNSIHNFNLTTTPEGFGPSDHASFYGKGVPVLMFFTDLHEDYHKPTDTYDKINSEGESKILKFIADLTINLNHYPHKPNYIAATKSEKQTDEKTKVSVYVGTIPDFASNTEGYKISGVSPGSPAEKAGLMAGDIIIKFGDKEIKNLYDYTAALAQFKPGNEVEVVVLRNSETVTLKLTLGKK